MSNPNRKIVETLCQVLDNTENQLTNQDFVEIISQFMFSIGSSLEGETPVSSEEVLKRYEKKKSLGNALMAQAMWIKETWQPTEREENDERTDI